MGRLTQMKQLPRLLGAASGKLSYDLVRTAFTILYAVVQPRSWLFYRRLSAAQSRASINGEFLAPAKCLLHGFSRDRSVRATKPALSSYIISVNTRELGVGSQPPVRLAGLRLYKIIWALICSSLETRHTVTLVSGKRRKHHERAFSHQV